MNKALIAVLLLCGVMGAQTPKCVVYGIVFECASTVKVQTKPSLEPIDAPAITVKTCHYEAWSTWPTCDIPCKGKEPCKGGGGYGDSYMPATKAGCDRDGGTLHPMYYKVCNNARGCANKTRILEHDEQTPPKYWCRKVQP
jgi:hypothetical protein